MTIRKTRRRGNPVLIVDILYRTPNGQPARYRRDAQVQTMTAARAEERRLLTALAQLGEIPTGSDDTKKVETEKPSVTFKDAVDHARRTKFVTSLKPSTRRGYNVLLDTVLLPRFAGTPLEQLARKSVVELDTELVESGLKPTTRRNVFVCLRSILRTAVDDELLKQMPQLPRLPRIGETIVKSMTEGQLDKLMMAGSGTARLAFGLAAHAGLRAGEVRGLRWPDIDLELGTITVRRSVCRGEEAPPKSGHQRVIPIAKPLLPMLKAAHDGKKAPWDAVSLTSEGKPWAEFSLRSAFRSASARAELSGWSFHSLRHYFVTMLFKQGAPAPVVKALAGHSTLAVTQRYAHVTDEQLKEAIGRLRGNSVVTGGPEHQDERVEGTNKASK
jgi:integrase